MCSSLLWRPPQTQTFLLICDFSCGLMQSDTSFGCSQKQRVCLDVHPAAIRDRLSKFCRSEETNLSFKGNSAPDSEQKDPWMSAGETPFKASHGHPVHCRKLMYDITDNNNPDVILIDIFLVPGITLGLNILKTLSRSTFWASVGAGGDSFQQDLFSVFSVKCFN